MKLENGDVKCPMCNGTGKTREWGVGDFKITPDCSNCNGEGKLDWIERIIGKNHGRLSFFDSVIQTASEEIRVEIDREILESIIEKIKKEKEEERYDHRVFSELMFRTTNQQIFKGETD